MKQKLAIIDLGTNTFHLLLAEPTAAGYTITHREKVAVKLGMGGINQDVIQPDAIGRALAVLKDFKTTIEQSGISTRYAFGTSALRQAHNGLEVTQQIQRETGIHVNIISGDEEADFIYYGVRSAMELGTDPVLIMDIGGGSVEFIIGNRDTTRWKKSIEIGAQRLLEKFHRQDPISTDEIQELNRHFEATLAEVFQALHHHQPQTLIGSSGTFDTLSDMHCLRQGIFKETDDAETPLTLESFHEIYAELIAKNRAERLRIPGMIEMRVDMIVVACCLIRFMLEKHSFQSIRVSSYSLKEGVLATITQQD
jgi:exopolyphosphatase/guanosine-5'-triphosphate,3'-diphosphate pyrophosphatase